MTNRVLSSAEQRVILDALENSIDHALFSDPDEILAKALLVEFSHQT